MTHSRRQGGFLWGCSKKGAWRCRAYIVWALNLKHQTHVARKRQTRFAVCRKEGAVEVRSEGEAQQVLQIAADAIHGLGPGGNVPHAPPQQSASAQGKSC